MTLAVPKGFVKLRIGNLSENATLTELVRFFGLPSSHSSGALTVQLIMNMKTGKCRGSGYIIVPKDLSYLVTSRDGDKYKGQELTVSDTKLANKGKSTDQMKSADGNKNKVKEASSNDKPSKPSSTPEMSDSQSEEESSSSGKKEKEKHSEEKRMREDEEKQSKATSASVVDSVVIKVEQEESKKADTPSKNKRRSTSKTPPKLTETNKDDLKENKPKDKPTESARPDSTSSPKAKRSKSKSNSSPTKKAGGAAVAYNDRRMRPAHYQGSALYAQPPAPLMAPPALLPMSSQSYHHSAHHIHRGIAGAPYDLVDIAAILTHGKFRGVLPHVISSAVRAGVHRMIIPGMDVPNSQFAAQIAFCHPHNVFFLAGVHPHFSSSWTESSLSELEHLLRLDSCVGIGECGLDWNRNYVSRTQQLMVYEKQVYLACKYMKPLLVHSRDCIDEVLTVLARYHSRLPPVVIHCIDAASVKKALNMGCYVGITGHLAKDRELRDMLRSRTLRLDSVMLESDSPYMYPDVFDRSTDPRELMAVTQGSRALLSEIRHRHTGNEPCSLPFLAEVVAGCVGLPPQKVAEITTFNSLNFFKL